jgi:hypothetical protein
MTATRVANTLKSFKISGDGQTSSLLAKDPDWDDIYPPKEPQAYSAVRSKTVSEVAASSSADHRRLRYRSAATNGRKLLPGIDGRSAWTRRCRDLIAAHIADLGGVENCSAAERNIVRRAAVLSVELERMEAGFAVAGEASADELDIYARVAGNLRRLLESVGLRRRARTVGEPTLADILAEDAHA